MTLWLLDLESVESRYTSQWKTHLPKLLEQFNVKVVEGADDIPPATTPGAFLTLVAQTSTKAHRLKR